MVKINNILKLRLKEKKNKKMEALAELSNEGSLSSFSGIFQTLSLNKKEEEKISEILKKFQEYVGYDITNDLKMLSQISSEIKAITNQAVILHGERIKKAQNILKNYKEGAFTSWLISTYGNRQTPYNFLQYYELYNSLPKDLHKKIDIMPRQVIYSLASRTGTIEKKEEIIKNYDGETKEELLELIRKEFPLNKEDKRAPDIANQSITLLNKLKKLFSNSLFSPDDEQKMKIYKILDLLYSLLEKNI
ncbi:MAG: hypothetical protein AMS24_05000 [Chlamydiae bacterium SM23_39]|nr:MAG: hypothetical protein AMS24_05000 [Chlamydiae bacterium SM23_39]